MDDEEAAMRHNQLQFDPDNEIFFIGSAALSAAVALVAYVLAFA